MVRSTDDDSDSARQPTARNFRSKVVWITDPHLNHVDLQAWDRWIAAIQSQAPDAVVITGDISEGDDVVFQLNRIVEAVTVPIYFVLGNHDFYQSSIAQTRQAVIAATRANPLLHYLTDCSPIELQTDVFLIGDDGWGDATEGDYEGSPIRLNDFALIKDFQSSDPAQWKSMLQDQGAQTAQRVRRKLESLPASAKEILVATHVPPFCASCWYQGHTTDENWAPFFVCGQLGRTLQSYFDAQSHQTGTVICGHTHHEGIATLSENLIVHTGAAVYGNPDLEATIHLGEAMLKLVSIGQR